MARQRKSKTLKLSNMGRANTDGKTFGSIGPCGYLYVEVTANNGQEVSMPVHQLVAETWLPPSPHGWDFAMHINGIITDNRAVNLKWVDEETAKEFVRTHLTNPFK